MPWLARLYAPGVLHHHVMGRGTERKEIFVNDTLTKSQHLDTETEFNITSEISKT